MSDPSVARASHPPDSDDMVRSCLLFSPNSFAWPAAGGNDNQIAARWAGSYVGQAGYGLQYRHFCARVAATMSMLAGGLHYFSGTVFSLAMVVFAPGRTSLAGDFL